MELIDREPLVRALTTIDRLARSDAQVALLGRVFYIVSKQPTIDAEPVRHGRWLRLDEAPEWDQRRCSECGDISCCQRNYCPNCGARMDGDGDAR